MIVIDASALIALIRGEAGSDKLADGLAEDQARLCSAVSTWETVAGLCRSYGLAVPAAETLVKDFLFDFSVAFVSMGRREWELAPAANARFGKGRHPAGLNMGDCFAYACAKANGARLLYDGPRVS